MKVHDFRQQQKQRKKKKQQQDIREIFMGFEFEYQMNVGRKVESLRRNLNRRCVYYAARNNFVWTKFGGHFVFTPPTLVTSAAHFLLLLLLRLFAMVQTAMSSVRQGWHKVTINKRRSPQTNYDETSLLTGFPFHDFNSILFPLSVEHQVVHVVFIKSLPLDINDGLVVAVR